MLGRALCITLLSISSLAHTATVLPSPEDSDGEHWYQTIAVLPATELAKLEGRSITVSVDLENSPSFTLLNDEASTEHTALYRMAFNNIAEGWSWTPLADPNMADYYRYKFLPLKSTFEEKVAPRTEEIYPGKWLEIKNLWRYDYFLAFENLYDFYPRQVNDDAGFRAQLKRLPSNTSLSMQARFRLIPPMHQESNTFWKADFADPVDYTLRKRYLMGELLEIRFLDKDSGEVLAMILPSR
ncbi:MAG: hypothetical protein Q8O37_06215 [Sulfuricellaceae bacterium]|nr:hypothetical protein [Sulfuricellaceae bacterium]